MAALQIESVAEPFESQPELTAAAVKLLLTSAYVGVLPVSGRQRLDLALVSALGQSLGEKRTSMAFLEVKSHNTGSARDAAAQIAHFRDLLERMQAEVEGSPRPDGEWAPVLDTLGEDMVAQLLGTSASSVRRYSAGDRPTPQVIAERLHLVALLLGELAGSYNDYGMRRWFTRPRTALGGRAPAELMGKDFAPDGPDGDRLRSLAAGLRAA